jgi:hypothetical protein
MKERTSSIDFSPTRFLEDQWIAEEEYHRTHFRDGSLRYEFRGKEDRLANCGKYISMYIGPDGTQKERREFRCKLPECEKCMEIRANQRAGNFMDRIEAVKDRVLFLLKFDMGSDQKRLREYAYRHRYEYLAVPDEYGGKIVIADGPIWDSEPIHFQAASKLVASLGYVMFLDRSKKVSGKLGKEPKKESASKEPPNFTSVLVRDYDFVGRRPTKAEIEIADVKSMSASGIALGPDGVINADNIQAVIREREDAICSIYQRMGYTLRVFPPSGRAYDLNAMNRVWARVEIGRHQFHGNMNGLSQFSKMLVSMAIDEHNSKANDDTFYQDVDRASSFFTLE